METKKDTSPFYKDLLALQNELRSVAADSSNPHYKSTYASLTGIIEYARPILTKHNFFMTQLVDTTDLSTHLIHLSGEKLVSNYPLPPNQDLTTVQKFGAALSYARRYSIMALLNLGVEDDDGNVTAAAKSEPRPVYAPEPPSANGSDNNPYTGHDFIMPFGDSKGVKASKCQTADITFAMSVFKKSIDDPKKAQFRENNERNLKAAMAILAERRKADELPF